MKRLPSDPFALQARVMNAMCEDLFDIGARRSTGFQRTDAIRNILKREAGSAQQAPASK